MRNFDAFAVALIAIILLGFSEIHLTPQPLGQGVPFQQAMLRQQIREQLRDRLQVLKCPNR